MSEVIHQANQLFREGHELKTEARKSGQRVEAYKQASEKFREAASLVAAFLESTETDDEVRTQAEVFRPYYVYEDRRCLAAYYYEKRDTEQARDSLDKSAESLDDHIRQLEDKLGGASGKLRTKFSDALEKAAFFRSCDKLFSDGIVARAAWDSGRFIDALDQYRRMANEFRQLVDSSEKLSDPVYHRITTGNYLAMLVNAASAMAKLHLESVKTDDSHPTERIPDDLACGLMRHLLDAYRYGMAAFDANPEWQQYRDHAILCRENMERFLKDNKEGWPLLCAELQGDPDLQRIMTGIDPDHLRAIEGGALEKKEDAEKTLWDRRWNWIKNHRMAVSIGVVFVVVVGVAAFAAALKRLWDFGAWVWPDQPAIESIEVGKSEFVPQKVNQPTDEIATFRFPLRNTGKRAVTITKGEVILNEVAFQKGTIPTLLRIRLIDHDGHCRVTLQEPQTGKSYQIEPDLVVPPNKIKHLDIWLRLEPPKDQRDIGFQEVTATLTLYGEGGGAVTSEPFKASIYTHSHWDR